MVFRAIFTIFEYFEAGYSLPAVAILWCVHFRRRIWSSSCQVGLPFKRVDFKIKKIS
jgi:hypothetical protein